VCGTLVGQFHKDVCSGWPTVSFFLKVELASRERGGRGISFPRNTSSEYRVIKRGRGSSVGTATGYGLDGPRIESRWGRDFSHTSRPVLGST
jgi:hypothetical protein